MKSISNYPGAVGECGNREGTFTTGELNLVRVRRCSGSAGSGLASRRRALPVVCPRLSRAASAASLATVSYTTLQPVIDLVTSVEIW
ncbi:unnamed protein product, partial [Brenthis ino]